MVNYSAIKSIFLFFLWFIWNNADDISKEFNLKCVMKLMERCSMLLLHDNLPYTGFGSKPQEVSQIYH